MRRKTALVLVLTLTLLFLCACKGNPLPEGMDEAAVLKAGREVVTQLNEGDWQAVYDSMREDGRESTTPEAIQAYMEDIREKAGDLETEKDAMATGQVLDGTGEAYGTAVLIYKHEKKQVTYRIAFSTDMELMGFTAKPI